MLRMIRSLLVPLCALVLATLPVSAAPPALPDTPAGRLAHAYLEAYAGGEPTMRAFFEKYASPADLAERPIDVRIGRWRNVAAQFGTLTLESVMESAPARVSLGVRSEKEGPLTLRIECADQPPHLLKGVFFEATGDQGGPGGGPGGPPPDFSGPPPSDEAIVARLQADLDSLARIDRFSGVAVLDKDGRTVFAKAWGMASREARRPNTLDTRFNIASIGKQFTSVAIRQLVAQGKLSLDDPVTKHLADYRVANAEKATIAMLLEHRGGVPDPFDSEELWKNPGRVRSASDWYALVRERPLLFEPGASKRYSNGGYVLLGMVIERVSGVSYYAYLEGHVYGPAGMTRTSSDLPAANATDVAMGYTRDPDGHGPGHGAGPGGSDRAPEPISAGFGRASAAGGNHATAADLVRYARALRDGRLLGKDAPESAPGGVGLGVAGGAPGTNALLELQGPYTLVILANQDPPVAEAFAETVGRMLAHAAVGAGGAARKGERAGGGTR